MANKPEKTLEQLKAEAELATQAYNIALKAEEQKRKEDAERKKAEMAAIREKRYKEVRDAEDKFIALKEAYLNDYGSYCAEDSYTDILRIIFPWMS